jgi:dienelactone hydrolase
MLTAAEYVTFLGGFPERGPLEVVVREEADAGDHTRALLEYDGDGVARVTAYLLTPRTPAPHGGRPGVVAIHQDGPRTHRDIGKGEPAGLLGDDDQQYGVELCRRGYVVLCPDRRWFEHRHRMSWDTALYGLRGDLFELHRAVDCLIEHSGADPRRVGAIGHSAGGWMAAMLTFTDPRVAACAVSCGTWLWRWGTLPKGERPEGRIPEPPVPGLGDVIDQDDFLAGIAPRPYLETRGDMWEGPFEADLTAKARRRYAALGVPERFQYLVYGHDQHAFRHDMRERSYAWLDTWLSRS